MLGQLDASGAKVAHALVVEGKASLAEAEVLGQLDASGAKVANALEVNGVSRLVGNVGIGKDASGVALDVSGNANIIGVLSATGLRIIGSVGMGAMNGTSLEVTGDISGASAHISGKLDASGAEVANDLTVGGTLYASKVVVDVFNLNEGVDMIISGDVTHSSRSNLLGNVGIGKENADRALDVSGGVIVSGELEAGSAKLGLVNVSGKEITNAMLLSSDVSACVITGGTMSGATITDAAGISSTGLLEVSGESRLLGLVGVGKQASNQYALDVSGAAHVSGNLTVDGTVFANAVAIDVSRVHVDVDLRSDSVFANTLEVKEGSTLRAGVTVTGGLSGESLYMSGAAAVGALTAASLSVAGGNMTVAGSSGNALFKGTMDVCGAAVMYGDLTMAGDLDVAGGKFTVGKESGLVVMSGELRAAGAVGVGKTAASGVALDVSGAISASSLVVSGDVSGASATLGELAVSGPATFENQITVEGLANLMSNVGVGKAATSYALDVSGDAVISGALSAASMSVAEDASVSGDLSLLGKIVPLGLQVDLSGDVAVAGGLAVTGGLGVAGGLVVGGAIDASGSALDVSGLVVRHGASVGGALAVEEGAAISGDLTVVGDMSGSSLHVSGDAAVGGKLAVSGWTDLSGHVGIGIDASESHVLLVNGAVGIAHVVEGESALDICGNVVTSGAFETGGGLLVSGGNAVVENGMIIGRGFGVGEQIDGELGAALDVSGVAIMRGSMAIGKNAATQGYALDVSGAALVDGDLFVDGDICGNTIRISGAAKMAGSMAVGKDEAAAAGLALDVSGAAAVSGALSAGAATVSSLVSSGNVAVGKSSASVPLDVSGAAAVSGAFSAGAATVSSLTSSGALSAGAATVSSLVSSGNVAVGKTSASVPLDVSGAIAVSGTLSAGAATVSSLTSSGALSAGAATVSSLTSSGTSQLTGNVGVGKAAGTAALDVSGAAVISSTLGVTGASTLSGNTTVGGTLGVTGLATLTGGLTTPASVTTTGSGALVVAGTSRLSGNVGVGKAAGTAALDVSGAAVISSTLGVTGASTLSGNTTIGGTLGVTGATTLSSTLGVTGASTLSGNTTVGGTLAVNGASTTAVNVGSGKFVVDTTNSLVGIGKTPAVPLDVNGSAAITGELSTTGNTAFATTNSGGVQITSANNIGGFGTLTNINMNGTYYNEIKMVGGSSNTTFTNRIICPDGGFLLQTEAPTSATSRGISLRSANGSINLHSGYQGSGNGNILIRTGIGSGNTISILNGSLDGNINMQTSGGNINIQTSGGNINIEGNVEINGSLNGGHIENYTVVSATTFCDITITTAIKLGIYQVYVYDSTNNYGAGRLIVTPTVATGIIDQTVLSGISSISVQSISTSSITFRITFSSAIINNRSITLKLKSNI